MYYIQFRKVYNDVNVSDWKLYEEIPPKMTVREAIKACQLYLCRDLKLKIRLVRTGFSDWPPEYEWIPFDGNGCLWEIEDNPYWQFRVIKESEVNNSDINTM